MFNISPLIPPGTVTVTVTPRGKPEGSALLIFASSEMTGGAH